MMNMPMQCVQGQSTPASSSRLIAASRLRNILFVSAALLFAAWSNLSIAQSINDCTRATAQDLTATSNPTINQGAGFVYAIPCARINPTQSITFAMDFGFHPLRGGIVSGFTISPQVGNPIPATSSGTSVTVTFNDAGEFGFACNNHAGIGMKGAVFVGDPPPPDAVFSDGFE